MNTLHSPSDRQWPWAVGAGVLLAILYTLSPLTVWTLTAAPLVIFAAVRGMTARERQSVIVVLCAALAVRVAAIAALFLISDHDSQAAAILFGDEAYTLSRTLRIRNVVLDIPALKYDYMIAFEDYGRTSYLWFVTAAQLLFGPSPYGLRLVNVLLFVAGAIMLFRVVRPSFGAIPAVMGLALLLFLPTWLSWSISILKEALYFFLTATVLTCVITCIRRESSRLSRVALALIAAAALFALRDLRGGAVVLVLSGLATGLLLYLLTGSVRRFVLGTLVLLVIVAALLSRPSVQQRVIGGLEAAAGQHIGHVFTVGQSYKLLDPGFYMTLNAAPRLSPLEAARFVARAAASFLVVPLPSQMTTRGIAQLPELLLWYVLVLLAPIGFAAGLARDRLATCLLIGYILPTAAVVALTNGNIGTLVRFRGLVTPYLVWIGCLGLCVIMQRLAASARQFDPNAAHLNNAQDTV